MSKLLCTAYGLFARELLIAWRRSVDVLTPLVFFVVITSLFPFGVGANPTQLAAIAPGIIWVAAALANLLSLQRLFADDYANGNLEHLLLSPYPLSLLVLTRISTHWILHGLPLLLVAPLLALQLNLPAPAMSALWLSLLLGTPTLALLGALGAALTLGLRSGGVLVSLLILPLYTPVLIFGAGAVNAAAHGIDTTGPFSLLAAGLILTLTFTPWATAAALRVSLD